MYTRVAYLGPEGTFTEAALKAFEAQGVFEAKVEPLSVRSPAAALGAVRSGEADYAVVAIENSVDGTVTGTYDALVAGEPGVQIFHETAIEIAFSIMVRPGMSRDEVRTLATHPIAYQQVRQWLDDMLPNVEFIAASSNAAAAEMVANGRADAAAAPVRAAEIYDLKRIADGVADERGARTRFVVVGRAATPTARTGADTTLLAFTLRNEPGALGAALQDFALRGVNLSRIASRPIPSDPGSYLFYVDLVGHVEDQQIAEGLRALWLRAQEVTFLGSWPTSAEVPEVENDARERLEAANEWVNSLLSGDHSSTAGTASR